MGRQVNSEGKCTRLAAIGRVAAEPLQNAHSVQTDIPERLPLLPRESDLVLQHLGEALADMFSR